MTKHTRRWLVAAGIATTALVDAGAGTVAAATTRTVGPVGSAAAFTSIQSAIAASADGDTVEVLPGTYAERIDFSGRDIVLRSTGGPSVTTIDGGRLGTVVTIDDGEGPATVLEGFTIRGAGGGTSSSGIRIRSSSPTIRGNRVIDNVGCSGIGIDVSFGSPLIDGNVVSGNVRSGCSGGVGGGGIAIGGDDGLPNIVRGNTITNNNSGNGGGGGITMNAAGDTTLVGNVITGNITSGDGGGIQSSNRTRATIVENLIADNSGRSAISMLLPGTTPLPNRLVGNTIGAGASTSGAVIDIDGWMSAFEIVDNVVVASIGPAVDCGDTYYNGDPTWTTNVFWAPAAASAFTGRCIAPGVPNATADPVFEPGTWTPADGSPLVDAGTVRAELDALDLAGAARVSDGNRDGIAVVDIGAYERQPVVVTVPGAPTAGTATRLIRNRVRLTWSPPADDGGAPIDHFVVVEPRSRRRIEVPAHATSVVINRIATTVTYRIEIRAVSAAGESAPLVVVVKRVRRTQAI